MPRYFTHYWRNSTWHHNKTEGADGDLLNHIAGNLFVERGVSIGDVVYVVTVIKGALYVCGKLLVGEICSMHEAAEILGCEPEDLWEADEHIIAELATPMRYSLKVPMKLTRQLMFTAGRSLNHLTFKSPDQLDEQTLRGVRELHPQSAAELDKLLPPLQEIDFADEETDSDSRESAMPEEVVDARRYYEGATKSVTVNSYERDIKARLACIAHYGIDCFICGFNFKTAYGDVGKGFIHVHHLKPLSEIGEEYEVDPIKDLRPICPNCHAIIHRRRPAYTIEEMRKFVRKR